MQQMHEQIAYNDYCRPGHYIREYRKKTGGLPVTGAIQKIKAEEERKKERNIPAWEMPTTYMKAMPGSEPYTSAIKKDISANNQMTPERAEQLVSASTVLNPAEDTAQELEGSDEALSAPHVALTDAHMLTWDLIDKAVSMLEEMNTGPTIIILSTLRYIALGSFLKHWKYSYQDASIPIVCADGHAKDDVVIYGGKKAKNDEWIL